jgi:mono/diheme cytochrome c family protein
MICLGMLSILGFSATGQEPKTGDSWTEFKKAYQAGKRSKVAGNVLTYDEIKDSEGSAGLQLKLEVGKKVLEIQLGPQWYILQHDINLTRGAPLVVEGIRIQLGSAPPTLIAEKAIQQNKEIPLRELSGEPLWKKAERKAPSPDSNTTRALTILMKNCAGCHQKANHPGAQMLQEKALSERATLKLILKMVETGNMPKQHREFRKTPDGQELLTWLRAEVETKD